jgi:hypothetical protein
VQKLGKATRWKTLAASDWYASGSTGSVLCISTQYERRFQGVTE